MIEPSGAPVCVALTGASGLIGRHLAPRLREAGHVVYALRRGDGDGENTWNVATGEIQTAGRVDVIAHLAGRAVWTGVRWTKRVRREIYESRVTATEKLCRYLAGLALERRPKLMISASGVGIYGNRGDEMLTEDSAPAPQQAFLLADVCRAWEATTQAAEDAGIRVIHLRIGVVLSREGGALAKLLIPAKLGLAGPIGLGMQFMPWIALTDVSRLIMHLMTTADLHGAVNVVAPHPVRQQEFIRTLGKVVQRPTVLALPAAVVKLAFGRMGVEALLMSQRVKSTRVPAEFRFKYETLEGALRAELGSRPEKTGQGSN